MADPVPVPITPAGAWQKVATAVTAWNITIKSSDPVAYYIDNRDTGNPAPADLSTAVRFDSSGIEQNTNDVAIDIYIYAVGQTGQVIVDV